MTEINEKVIDRIKKLLALANNNSNEAEASAAMAKATEMLETYNLDMATIGNTAQGRPRKDQKQKGGLYGWQRKLWQAVAELNFCAYWSIKGLAAGSTYEHRILGSHANVVSTEVMADYLQKAIERLAQQWAKDVGHKSVFVREAIAYREGMAARIVERLQLERQRRISEQEQRKREEAARARHPGAAPMSTALTLVDVASNEADLNNDYLNGWEEGTTAAKRAEQKAKDAAWAADYEERQAKKQAEHEERYANDPEYKAEWDKKKADEEKYWADLEAKWAKRNAKNASRRKEPTPRYRKATPEEERAMMSEFYAGRAAGNNVGLDQQVDKEDRKGIK